MGNFCLVWQQNHVSMIWALFCFPALKSQVSFSLPEGLPASSFSCCTILSPWSKSFMWLLCGVWWVLSSIWSWGIFAQSEVLPMAQKATWSGHLLPLWIHLLLLHLPFPFRSGHLSTLIVLKHTQHAPNSCHGIFCFLCLELSPLDIYGASLYPSGKSERPFQTAPSKM